MAKFDLSKGGIRTSKKTAAKTRSDGQGIGGRTSPRSGGAYQDDVLREAARTPDSAGPDMNAELSMSVSGICGEPGSLFAFVRFEDGTRCCEFKFPEVELSMSDGFSEEELVQLKFYVANHITELKKMAASIDPISAMLK